MNIYRALAPVTPQQPKVSSLYLRELDEEKEGRTSYFQRFCNRILGKSQESAHAGKRPVNFPVDPVGYDAVYGLHKMRGIHGPADWDQFYGTWDRVGQQYDRLHERGKPFIREYIDFLKKIGVSFINEIGSGGFGEVWSATAIFKKRRRSESGEIILQKLNLELACKILALKSLNNMSVSGAVQTLLNEIEIHRALNHENVVKVEKFIKIYDKGSDFPKPIFICIFMELCDGSLDQLIWNEWRLSEDKTHEWFQQISEGLRYLHSQNVVHLDLKPNNILYKRDSSINLIYKLTDFGLSQKYKMDCLTPKYNVPAGTPKYIAPEVIFSGLNIDYETKPADIYSLGITLAASVAGMGLIFTNFKRYKKYGISKELIHLITAMTRANPSHRPTIQQLCNDAWVNP
jgi:serine/threonine protein kinase